MGSKLIAGQQKAEKYPLQRNKSADSLAVLYAGLAFRRSCRQTGALTSLGACGVEAWVFSQDNEAVLEYLLQRGEATRALAVLRRPGVSPELLYKFAPALVAAAPGPTVDAWLAAQPPLEPRRLLPALLRLGEADAPKHARADVLRYVRFCVGRLGSTDAAVHNLAARPAVGHTRYVEGGFTARRG